MAGARRTISGSVFDSPGTVRKNALGTFQVFSDGRKYRYVDCPSAVPAGTPVKQAAACDTFEASSNFDATGVAGATKIGITADGGSSAGVEYTANQLAGGTIVIVASTIVYTYHIVANDAMDVDTGWTGLKYIYIDPHDPIKTAFTNSATGWIALNPYVGSIGASTTKYRVIGINHNNAAFSSTNRYGWVQTRGICGTVVQGEAGDGTNTAIAAGGAVGGSGGSDTDSDYCLHAVVAGDTACGIALDAVASDGLEYIPVLLTIE